MTDGVPKILFTIRCGALSPEVHVQIHVLIERPDRDSEFLGKYKRFAGIRGPNAEQQAKDALRPFITAVEAEGSGVTAVRLVELATAWERGDLHDVH